MSGKLDKLRSRVGSVMRLARARGFALGVALVALVMGGAFIAASVFDIAFRLGATSRGMLLAASAIAAIWAAVRSGRSSPADDGTVAREVERSFPEIESSLSTAIEFGSDAEKTEAFSSREIVDGLVEMTETRTEPLPLGRAVDWRAVRRACAGLAAIGIVVLLYAFILPHMAAATAARFWNPFSDAPPPTWTVILSIDPGTREVVRGERVSLRARLGGSRPDSVRVLYRGEGDEEWLASNMSADLESDTDSADDERVFLRTLRVTRRTEYRVIAGDAESPTYRLWPVEAPRVEAIRVRVVPPEYTGLPAEDLPEGAGDVRAVEGSRIEIRVRTNRKVESSSVALTLDSKGKKGDPAKARTEISVALEPAPSDESEPGKIPDELDGEELVASFVLTKSGEYRVRLEDSAGRTNSGDEPYRLTAVLDRAPLVKVTDPDKDVSAHKSDDVVIEIEASDDYGIAEVGIVHTLTGKPVRHSVERPAAGTKRSESSYPVRLALAGLKGGEIITYYPFAIDSKGTETKGDVRFLHTYDEEPYSDMPSEEAPPPSRAVREVSRLVERQQNLTRDTFGAARASEDKKAREASAGRSARKQDDVKRDLDDLVREVEEELKSAAHDAGAGEPGMAPEELVLLKEASEDMKAAAESLLAGEMDGAAASQSEALSALSRTRRILLSQSSSSSASQAMAKASDRRQQKRREERKNKLDKFREEMQKLPPMLKREERERRKLERLDDEPPPPGEAGDMADEQRRLAEEARKLASKMDKLRRDDPSMPKEPSERLQEAADRAERAASSIERGDSKSAARAAAQAAKNMRDAEAAGERAMKNMDRDTLKGATAEAEEIAREQSKLARDSAKASARQQAQEKSGEKSDGKSGEQSDQQASKQTGEKSGEKSDEQKDAQAGNPSGEKSGEKADAESQGLARRQEDLAKRMKELESSIESLAENAAAAGRPEAGALRQADFRQHSSATSELMNEAAEHLRGGRPEIAEAPQQFAAKSAKSLADDLAHASRVAEGAGQRDVAEAIRRAEELAKEIGRIEAEAGDASRKTAPAAAKSRQLSEEAKEISDLAARLPRGGAAGEIKKARESLDRAERRLADAAAALDMKDRVGGAAASRDAREEAERASAALRRMAASDLARELTAAREAAAAAARQQTSARKSAEAARDAGADAKSQARSRADAARSERSAEKSARQASQKLASAASAARGAGSELAEWIAREAERARREGLPGQMGDLASRLETPTNPKGEQGKPGEDESDASKEAREQGMREARDARELEKAAHKAAGRFDSLVAEAKGDDLEALRAAGEDAMKMAERLRELDSEINKFRKGDDGSGMAPTEERVEQSKKLGQELREANEDAGEVRKRAERRASEVLGRKTGTDGRTLDETIKSTAGERRELQGKLSKNMTLPRSSNALSSTAMAYQSMGDGIIEKVERILREREYRPPEDEEAPEEFRELVDRYFRALSEDH